MDVSAAAVPKPAHRYRLPALLQDIRLLDLLEISGTSLEASRVCGLSQPTVSRRTRVLAEDFYLQMNRRRQLGCRYGTSTAMQLLRLGCRAHRLSAGVARLGADVILQPLLAGCSWLLPAPPRFRPLESWLELVHQGVLDGALVSGLEFAGAGPRKPVSSNCCRWVPCRSSWRSQVAITAPMAPSLRCWCRIGRWHPLCSGSCSNGGSPSGPPATPATHQPSGWRACSRPAWPCPSPRWRLLAGGRSSPRWLWPSRS